MFDCTGLNLGLGSLPLLSDAKTRSISAENPDGQKGGGAKADPKGQGAARELGIGWKVRPCISLEPGTTTTLADIAGPGVIQHIWITVDHRSLDGYRPAHLLGRRADALGRIAAGRVLRQRARPPHEDPQLPVAVNPTGGFNSYWPMPFRKHARITVENQRQ